jgi:hypothetical protein
MTVWETRFNWNENMVVVFTILQKKISYMSSENICRCFVTLNGNASGIDDLPSFPH